MDVYTRELRDAINRIEGLPADLADCVPSPHHWQPWLARMPGLRPVARYLNRYGRYQWYVRGRNGDVNHIVDHGYSHLAFSLDPRRTVVTFHDAVLLRLQARELPTDAYPWFTMLGQHLSLAAMTRVARLITVSESSKRDLLRFTSYDPARVRVIYEGVSPHFRPLPRSHTSSSESHAPRILHVGHCGVYKNIEGILKALPRISQRLGRRVLFIKVGGPFTASQLAMIDRLGIAGQVDHRGMVAQADLMAAYNEADLLLMPSWHEGFGLPVLEAMSCGVPVVASNQASLPEVVGDAGLLVEPQDVEAIADAVGRVLTDAVLQETLRQRGLERASQFTWERTALETMAVYREIYEETH